jgi:hypothetical protein
MIRARICHREPTSGAQHPRRFGEILGREDAYYEIDGGVLHRPFAPQIRDSKREPRPPPRSLSSRLSRNVEADTGDRRWERFGYPCKMMSRARPGIEDAPSPECGLGFALLNVLHDRGCDWVKIASIEECSAVPQLHCAVAARGRAASPTAQETDVPLTGEVEAVAIAANECACRDS